MKLISLKHFLILLAGVGALWGCHQPTGIPYDPPVTIRYNESNNVGESVRRFVLTTTNKIERGMIDGRDGVIILSETEMRRCLDVLNKYHFAEWKIDPAETVDAHGPAALLEVWADNNRFAYITSPSSRAQPGYLRLKEVVDALTGIVKNRG
jgi:hypothetical protein